MLRLRKPKPDRKPEPTTPLRHIAEILSTHGLDGLTIKKSQGSDYTGHVALHMRANLHGTPIINGVLCREDNLEHGIAIGLEDLHRGICWRESEPLV